MRLLALFALAVPLSAGGCATAGDLAGKSATAAVQDYAATGSCRPAGPHDVGGPTDRMCTDVTGEERAIPASRTR